MEVIFRAPRFDAAGNKTETARFESVRVNGQLVQENISVIGPTRSNPMDGEVARGPIVVQGDHGPVAIRRFVVKPL
ncbi:hypothetical protein SCARR_02495 [Pontiella sulfatireligans]|uniref:3-keto-disaccharide hydrolase domain-containing protein n=2 Tax=Pontiella sulfatireligans TaxID=2750658 RepID=A0A6C2UJM6_9BACT|nr:hypothetical protein SCARR_02495 [Pontiella sulfatireligans]